MKKQTSDIELGAIRIVNGERSAWEDATAFITERVAFNMRNLIRQLRKNYYGIFDQEIDPTTNRKKIWIPLTEYLVESVVKNIDLDTKDINFRAKKDSRQSIAFTGLVRSLVKNYLDNSYFGEDLDEFERNLAIDGTSVWKTVKVDGEAKRIPVELLNIYIDPTARSIQECYRFTERSLMSADQVKAMNGWENTEGIEATVGLSRTDSRLSGSTATSNTKYCDVWEMWGRIPKSLITGDLNDKDEIDGHIVVSGLEKAGKERVHLIEENKKGQKPYEEAWYTRVPGRWYGRGIAEKVMMLQLYINTIVNIRVNRSYISQLGIFKVKKNAGVTPQMVSRLAANGAITVNSMDDIEQFVMQEASQASYSDEQNIRDWAERLTSSFEVVTGESLPSSTPATNAAIQSRSAQSQFVLIKEGIGMFLQRWIKRHLLPILQKSIKPGDILRYEDDQEKIRELDELAVNYELSRKIIEANQAGFVLDPMQVDLERQRALDQRAQLGKDRFVKLLHEVNLSDYDVQVFVSNEEIDKSILANNLLSALQMAPEFREQILRQVFDVMGLPPLKAPQGNMMQQLQGQSAQPGSPNPNSALTEANTVNNPLG